MIIRGVEGGIVPSLRQPGRYFAYRDGGPERGFDIDPGMLGIAQECRAAPIPVEIAQTEKAEGAATLTDVPAAARKAAELGLAALGGEKGPTYDSLVYSAALVLNHLGRSDGLTAAGEQVRAVLDSGRTVARVR